MRVIEFCRTKDQHMVVYDPEHSHTATHLRDTPGLSELVREVLANTDTTGERMWFETDMGRVVGVSDLVETDNFDEIVYAQRPNREGFARFTKSRPAQPCSTVTIAIRPLDEQTYELESAWIGPKGYPFPDTPEATAESAEYWATRALVWGSQEVVPGSETKTCPWPTC